MASFVYPDFGRLITVFAADGTTPRNVYGGSNEIQSICESASFVLTAERGCGQGQITLGGANSAGQVYHDNPFLLSRGDVIFMTPESGADAWYCGTVTRRRRGIGGRTLGRQVYTLDGLAVKLNGVPATEDPTAPLHFGTGAGSVDDTHFPTLKYPSSDSGLGIVQWLLANPIADVDGIDATTGNYNSYEGLEFSTDTQIERMVLDHESDLGVLMFDLARQLRDTYGSPARPAIWGIGVDRRLYFYLRPDVDVMQLSWVTSASEARGQAVVTIGGTRVYAEGVEPQEGGQFWNCLGLRGGIDSSGDFVQGFYTDSTSIAKYGRRCVTHQDVPHLRSSGDASGYAAAFFDRYADPGITYEIEGLAIPAADKLPLPWAGHCVVAANATDDEDGGNRTIRAVQVQFDETPIAKVTIGEGEESQFAALDGNPRHPGISMRRAMDRTPRAKTPGTSSGEGSVVPSLTSLPEHGHTGPSDGGWGGPRLLYD